MARKIRSVSAYPWNPNVYSNGTSPQELDSKKDLEDDILYRGGGNSYRMMFGGIDSNDVTERLKAPNGIIANIMRRMGNEVACTATPHDFSKPIQERQLFRFAEPTYQPEDQNGFIVQGSIDKIKQNIQYLHWRVLGERLEIDDPEVDRTYQLFLETWREGRDMTQMDRDRLVYCFANVDYYSGIDLFNAPLGMNETRTPEENALFDKGHRRIDPTSVTRAWQAVLAYLLSDHAFLYE
jgi:hypothetical protein